MIGQLTLNMIKGNLYLHKKSSYLRYELIYLGCVHFYFNVITSLTAGIINHKSVLYTAQLHGNVFEVIELIISGG